MTAFVVDTNVPIVASGRAPQADDQCHSSCVGKLGYLMKQGTVAIDDKDAILKGNCSPDLGSRMTNS